MSINFAKRAKDHQYALDPIVRSLLDTDFYKLAMQQMIWKKKRDINVTFAIKNRTADIRLADIISEKEIREQLDYIRDLRFTRGEITWLRGNSFYGKKNIFESKFIDFLEKDFRLPEYELKTNSQTGQYELTSNGDWCCASMWEIPFLMVINTLRNRALMRHLNLFQMDVMFARAKSKLWQKIELLYHLDYNQAKNIRLADFGSRRRFDYLWQEWAVEALKEGLGDHRFIGTSNCLIAMKHDLEAIGTNAHELPMVYAALADSDEELLHSPYEVLKDWGESYQDNMRIILPDTFGTSSFLKFAPDWVKNWRGFRLDSKDNFEGGHEFIQWWKDRGEDPKNHMVIHSDGLDIGTGDHGDIIEILNEFQGKYNVGFGWGTKLTNDFVGCVPEHDANYMKPISLVCKVRDADGRDCVKLSDNWEKATGPVNEVDRYKKVFGEMGHVERDLVV